MKSKAWLFTIAIAVFLYPVAALARDDAPVGKWWQIPKLSESLGLSQAEKGALDTLYVQSRRSLMEMKNDLEKERFELDTILEKQNSSDRAAMEQFRKVEKRRENLASERFRYLLEVRKILGQDRYQKLMNMSGEFREKRGRERNGASPVNE